MRKINKEFYRFTLLTFVCVLLMHMAALLVKGLYVEDCECPSQVTAPAESEKL